MGNFIERIIALLILILLLPFLILIAILVFFETRGNPFFVQERIGKDKKRFKLFKFRSMYVDGDKRLQDYLSKNPEAKKEWETYRKLINHDPRVTRIGRWLRRYSIDEILQLVNIVKGDMSFVGPRPYVPEELERFTNDKEIIFSVRPGLTGPWQVGGRNKLTFSERLKIESEYVKSKNLKNDVKILFKTIPSVIKKDGAF